MCCCRRGTTRTHRELGGSGTRPVEAQHDNLQAVAAVGALEQPRSEEIRGQQRRKVDPPVGQAVATETRHWGSFT